jgi:hypothetical protein
MHTLHPLELSLYSVLHVLGVDYCHWIYKVQGVVHSVVDVHRLQLLDMVVGSPLITVYCCPIPMVALQYWQEFCCCLVRYNSQYTECRCLTGIAHPENPHFVPWRTSTVILENSICITDWIKTNTQPWACNETRIRQSGL